MDTLKKLTPKQTKIAWIVTGILILLHFAPAVLHTVIAAATSHKETAAYRKPSPSVPSPVPVLAVVPANGMFPDARLSTFVGIWQANQFMPNGDHCNVRLEIRQAVSNPVTQSAMVSGFDTRTCLSSDLMKGGNMAATNMEQFRRETSPVSTSMMGWFADDSDITFQVNKTLGAAPNQCPMTAYTVSPFGTNALAAQWKQGICPGGQIVLQKVR